MRWGSVRDFSKHETTYSLRIGHRQWIVRKTGKRWGAFRDGTLSATRATAKEAMARAEDIGAQVVLKALKW